MPLCEASFIFSAFMNLIHLSKFAFISAAVCAIESGARPPRFFWTACTRMLELEEDEDSEWSTEPLAEAAGPVYSSSTWAFSSSLHQVKPSGETIR